MSGDSDTADATHGKPQKFLLVFVGALGGFGPASIDMYLPGFLAIAQDLETSYANVQLTLSIFLAGFSLGQLVVGPLSDRFGRRPLLIGGISLFCLSSLGCMVSPNIGLFVLFRLLQSLGGCVGQAVGRAIIRDAYHGTGVAKAMSYMMLVVAITPLVAPLIGSYVVEAGSWRIIFAILFGFGLICLAASIFFYRETLPWSQRSPLNFYGTIRGYGVIFGDRRALGYLLGGGFAFATMFAYISGGPGVFMEYYGISPREFALVFAVNIVGFASGSVINSRVVGRVGIDRMLTIATGLSMVGAILLALAGWTGLPSVILFALVLFLAICSVHTMFANSIAGLLNLYPSLAGTASAMFGAVQFGFGAIAGLLVGQFFTGDPRSMVTVMLITAFLSFAAHRFLTRGAARKAG